MNKEEQLIPSYHIGNKVQLNYRESRQVHLYDGERVEWWRGGVSEWWSGYQWQRRKRLHEHNITPALLAAVAQEGSKVVFVFTKLAFYCVHGTACNIEVGP